MADHHLFSNIQYQFGHQDSQQIFTCLLSKNILCISSISDYRNTFPSYWWPQYFVTKYLNVQASCPDPPLGLCSTTQEMGLVREAPPYLAQMCQIQRSATLHPYHQSAPSGEVARASRTRGRRLRARCQNLSPGTLVRSPLCLLANLSSRRPAQAVTLASAIPPPRPGASPTPHLTLSWSLTRWFHITWIVDTWWHKPTRSRMQLTQTGTGREWWSAPRLQQSRSILWRRRVTLLLSESHTLDQVGFLLKFH